MTDTEAAQDLTPRVYGWAEGWRVTVMEPGRWARIDGPGGFLVVAELRGSTLSTPGELRVPLSVMVGAANLLDSQRLPVERAS